MMMMKMISSFQVDIDKNQQEEDANYFDEDDLGEWWWCKYCEIADVYIWYMMYMELIDNEICREYAATTAEKESLEEKDKFLHRKKVGAGKIRWWLKW